LLRARRAGFGRWRIAPNHVRNPSSRLAHATGKWSHMVKVQLKGAVPVGPGRLLDALRHRYLSSIICNHRRGRLAKGPPMIGKLSGILRHTAAKGSTLYSTCAGVGYSSYCSDRNAWRVCRGRGQTGRSFIQSADRAAEDNLNCSFHDVLNANGTALFVLRSRARFGAKGVLSDLYRTLGLRHRGAPSRSGELECGQVHPRASAPRSSASWSMS